METFFESYLERLEALHGYIAQALEGLSPEALDWSPGPEMNSLAVLVTHLTGAERYWIGDVALGEPSNRDREAEFRVHGLDPAALTARLDGTLAYARQALDSLSLQDLEKERRSTRDGQTFSAGWALLHALEHTGIHLGQVQYTRQMWDQKEVHK